MARRDGRDAERHGLDGDQAERLFPRRGQQDRARRRHQLGAPLRVDLAGDADHGRAAAHAATSSSSGPAPTMTRRSPWLGGLAACVAVPAGHQQAQALGLVEPPRVDHGVLAPGFRHAPAGESGCAGRRPGPGQAQAARAGRAATAEMKTYAATIDFQAWRCAVMARATGAVADPRAPVAPVPERRPGQAVLRSRGRRLPAGRSRRWRRPACSCGWSRRPGPPASRQAYKTAGAQQRESVVDVDDDPACARGAWRVSARRASAAPDHRAGRAARLAAGHCSMSSLCRSNAMTSCPRSRRA